MGYFLAALLSGFFLFNSAATPQKAAKMAEKALQKQYPSAKVNVKIEGKRGTDVLKGRFRLVRVEMSNLAVSQLPVTAPTGSLAPNNQPKKQKIGRAQKIEVDLSELTLGKLPVSRARLDFERVQYDFEALKNRAEFQILQSGPATMQLQLSMTALLPSFAEKLKNTDDVTVAIEGKTMTLRGTRQVLGTTTPLIVSGELSGRGAQLRLENATLSLGGITLSGVVANALLKDLNPLYDFDKGLNWPFQTQITDARGQGNQLDLKANLSAPPVGTGANSLPEKRGNNGVPVGQ